MCPAKKFSPSRLTEADSLHTPKRKAIHLTIRAVIAKAKLGEGLIIRTPEALYLEGQRAGILKVKSFQENEVVVSKHLPSQSRGNACFRNGISLRQPRSPPPAAP